MIIANHMSTFETLILPVIAGGRRPLSFVLKESLPKYPIFGPVVLAGRPIVVGRTNPREDLRVVLHEGMARLEAGRNVVVFPQGHRRPGFEAENFNSMGIKLAKRAGVLVVPLALMTDFWSEGRRVKGCWPYLSGSAGSFCLWQAAGGGWQREGAARTVCGLYRRDIERLGNRDEVNWMIKKPVVLFLCTGNSCRSQMAEGWLRTLHGGLVEARSAGIVAHGLNPYAVQVMADAGVDITGQASECLDAHNLRRD